MRPIQRIISAGFATAAIASASLPALSGSVWPNVDFEWYANVGKGRVQQADASSATFPTGPATTRGPDTAIATPPTPAAAEEVSRR